MDSSYDRIGIVYHSAVGGAWGERRVQMVVVRAPSPLTPPPRP